MVRRATKREREKGDRDEEEKKRKRKMRSLQFWNPERGKRGGKK